jgi:predicted RecA/RadA family phage recombinase
VARNFVQPGSVLTLPAPYDVVSGQGALIGDFTFGVALLNAAIVAPCQFQIDGVWDLTKDPDEDLYLPGMRIYWNDAGGSGNGYVTAISTSHPLIGTLAAAAGVGTATARVRLSGAPDPTL